MYTRCTGGLFHERCSIYELDLASGHERRVSALATRRASVVNPSVWAGRYAFGRVAIEGRERAGRNFGLYTGIGRAHRLGSRRPGSTDVDANVVAYEGGTAGNRVQHYEIRVHRLRGRSDCRIARATERLNAPRNDNTVSSPGSQPGSPVYWNLSGSLGTSPVHIMRVPIPGPDCKRGQVERGTVDLPPVSSGLAVDGAKAFYANYQGVFEIDLPAFAPRLGGTAVAPDAGAQRRHIRARPVAVGLAAQGGESLVVVAADRLSLWPMTSRSAMP